MTVLIHLHQASGWIQPEKHDLVKVYPNPFNERTTLSFDMLAQGDVRVNVYDLSGGRVDELRQGGLSPGRHQLTWNASGKPSGVYILEWTGGGQRQLSKVLLLK